MDINTRDMGFVNFNEEDMQWVKVDGVVVYEAWKNLTANGVPPLTLTNCKGVDLVDYKIFGNSVPEETRLPDEYQEVEYIENRGAQYIDTGVLTTNSTGIDVTYKALSYATSQYIAGSRTGWSGTIYYGVNGSGSRTEWDVRFDSVVTYSPIQRSDHIMRSKIIMVDGNGTWDLTDLETGENSNIALTNKTVASFAPNLYLFAYSDGNIHQQLRMYSCKIYDGETVVRDFIPCYRKSDNIRGMYDLINGVFHEEILKTTTNRCYVGNNTGVELESVGEKTKNLWEFNVKEYTVNTKGNVYKFIEPITKDCTFYFREIDFTADGNIWIMGFRYKNGNYVYLYPNHVKQHTIRNISATEDNPLIQVEIRNGGAGYISGGKIDNLMLVEGTYTADTMPEFEPYGYKVPVKVHSKNWFDINNPSTDRIYNALVENIENGFRYTANNNGAYTTYVSYLVDSTELLGKRVILSGDTILSEGNIGMFRFGYWSTANAFKAFAMKQISKNGYQELIVDIPDTLPDDYKTGMAIFFNVTAIANMKGATFEVTNIKLELEPITTNLYLDEPLRKLGDYADIIDFKQGKVIRKIGKYTYDGSEDWIKNASTTDGYGAFRCEGYFTPLIGAPANMSYMTHFNYTTKGATADFKPGEFRFAYTNGSNIGSSRVYMATIQTTVEDFIDWITKNKPTIYYPIEDDPEEINLPNISTYNGTTILEINTDIQPSNLDVIYKGKK